MARQEPSRHTSEVAGDMVALRTGGATIFPLACETEIVGRLPADVVVAKMIVERFRV